MIETQRLTSDLVLSAAPKSPPPLRPPPSSLVYIHINTDGNRGERERTTEGGASFPKVSLMDDNNSVGNSQDAPGGGGEGGLSRGARTVVLLKIYKGTNHHVIPDDPPPTPLGGPSAYNPAVSDSDVISVSAVYTS